MSQQGSSDRSFGLVFSAFFLLVGLLPLYHGMGLRWWAVGLSAAFALTAWRAPTLLAPLNRLWTAFGLLLHRIVSPLVMTLLFFLVVTPMALLMRLVGRRPLALDFDKNAESYWIPRPQPGPTPESMKHQF